MKRLFCVTTGLLLFAGAVSAQVSYIDQYKQQYTDAKETSSGLVYRILAPGNEQMAVSVRDTVEINYSGYLMDGSCFVNTRNHPVTTALDKTIKGWQEGLQLVGKGGMIEMILPPELAYGEQGNDKVGPNQVVRFIITLERIREEETPAEIVEDFYERLMNGEKWVKRSFLTREFYRYIKLSDACMDIYENGELPDAEFVGFDYWFWTQDSPENYTVEVVGQKYINKNNATVNIVIITDSDTRTELQIRMVHTENAENEDWWSIDDIGHDGLWIKESMKKYVGKYNIK